MSGRVPFLPERDSGLDESVRPWYTVADTHALAESKDSSQLMACNAVTKEASSVSGSCSENL